MNHGLGIHKILPEFQVNKALLVNEAYNYKHYKVRFLSLM
jgi:hypothetical protein